jgi:hypothetical protein
MDASQLSLKDLSLGERMILAAQLAVARHWFNQESNRRSDRLREQSQPETNNPVAKSVPIGGADHARIDDPFA